MIGQYFDVKGFPMDLRTMPGYRYYFWVGFSLILIFAILKPAATSEAGFFKGLVIWTFQIGVLLPILIFVHISLQRIGGPINGLSPWLKLVLSGGLGSVLFIPFGLGIDYGFGLDDWSAISGLDGLTAMLAKELGGVLLPATFTWVAINAPLILRLNFKEIDRGPAGITVPPENGRTPATLPGFYRLLPAKIGRDVVYLKAELHYVRVVTVRGEALVLFNLKDAIEDVQRVACGIQTHRSYWVAGAHIKKIVTEDGRRYLLTTHNQRIPVSRRRSAQIKAYLQQARTC